MSKELVAYFSASGRTKKVANRLSEDIGADLFEIEPKEEYTSDDLNWNDKNSRTSVEMNDELSRPAMKKKVNNMESYDTIFVGFPIWWYDAPRIISTFLESYDFSGKRLIVFATSGSSGMGKIPEKLKKLCPYANFVEGKVLNNYSDAELKNWANKF